jgi:uncharacterized protein (TIGR02246 family)
MMKLSSAASGGPESILAELTRAWSVGNGSAFARPFQSDAIFVAFDGTVLRGAAAIGQFHQRAFSSHLAGTQLQVEIEERRELAPGLTLVLTRGGIRRNNETHGDLIGPSIQTLLIRDADDQLRIETFQNTRDRPITGPNEAQVWREFDQAWTRIAERQR